MSKSWSPFSFALGIGFSLMGFALQSIGVARWVAWILLGIGAVLVITGGLWAYLNHHAEPADVRGSPNKELRTAALLLRSELRDIQRKVANVEATIAGHTYADGFAFPGHEWARHQDLIATQPGLHAVVQRAYAKSHRANEMLALRRTRSEGRQIGRADEEDLPGVRRLAGEAIAALNTVIGDSPEDAYRQSVTDQVEKARDSFHSTFDNWQEMLTLAAPELLSWLSLWERTFQSAADEIGGETIATRMKRWIASINPADPAANEALLDRIDAAMTQTLAQLRGASST